MTFGLVTPGICLQPLCSRGHTWGMRGLYWGEGGVAGPGASVGEGPRGIPGDCSRPEAARPCRLQL